MVEAIVNLGDIRILRSMVVDILLRFGVVVWSVTSFNEVGFRCYEIVEVWLRQPDADAPGTGFDDQSSEVLLDRRKTGWQGLRRRM